MPELNTVEVLRKAFPELEESALVPLAALTTQDSYPAGTLICREGDHEEIFYIIGTGEVEFTKHFTQEEERLLRTGGPGVYFGEMAIIQRAPRNANVRALTDVGVLKIDRNAFYEAIQANPVMMLDMVRTLIERLRSNDATALDEMRRQKDEIAAAYEELRHQELLRNDFLNTLAHELRTPLTSATGYLQLIKAGTMSGPALSLGIQKVSTNLDHIVSLVNDLLFIQEQDLIEPILRPVSLPELFEIAVDEVRDEAAQQNATIHVEVPDSLPVIQADPDGLLRAFTKLLDNAVKFSPNGGEVRIIACSEDRWVEIDFCDQGVGIDETFKPRLFQQFERTDRIGDRVYGGIGLGLVIVKHIIESHGGTISVESEPGQGSTFSVRLPLDGGRTQLGAQANSSSAEASVS